jgi:hypothetical protein
MVSVPYLKTEHEFEVHVCPLMDWALNLLKDPSIGPHAIFDAEHLYKYNGEKFICFYDEPWTANAFWEAQVGINSQLKYIYIGELTTLIKYCEVKAS